jgi:hypothetical protein
MLRRLYFILITVFVLSAGVIPLVYAAGEPPCSIALPGEPCVNSNGDISNPGGSNQFTSNPGGSAGSVALPCPLGSNEDCKPAVIIGNVIKVTLGLVGSLALIIFIYGGLIWMTSAGNKDRVTQGRNTLIWASLGLIVIFSSYTVINFILRNFANQT